MMNRLIALLLGLFTVTPGYAQFADQATFVGTGGGTANAQTITIANAASLTNLRGVLLKYIPAASNTGATTLAVTGLAATSVLKPSNNSGLAALSGGEIRINQPALLMYDGTEFVLFNVATGGALCGASGLTITNNGVSLVTITYLSATVTDAAGVATYLPGATVTINLAAANGAGALDTGSQTANTWYYSYLIYNGTANALGSTSSTAPTIPAGYYGSCRLGAFRGGGTAATLVNTRQLGTRVQYIPSVSITTTPGSYWTAQAVGNFVPTTATTIKLTLSCTETETTNTNSCGAAPNNTYGGGTALGLAPMGFFASASNTLQILQTSEWVLESTNVYTGSLVGSGSTLTYNLLTLGWTESVNAN